MSPIFALIVNALMMEQEDKKSVKIGKTNVGWIRNKYFIASLVFVLWVLLFDQNNLLGRFQNYKILRQLKYDREFYHKKISEDSIKIKELKTHKDNLEKFIREEYMMKKENEDVYVLIDEK